MSLQSTYTPLKIKSFTLITFHFSFILFYLHFCLLIFSYLWLHHLIYKYVSVLCYAKWKNLPEIQMDPLSSNPLAVPFQKSKERKCTSYTGNCWSLCMKALKHHWKHYQQIELPKRAKRPTLVLSAIWVCARILLHLLPHSGSTVYKSDSQMLCTFYHIVVDTAFSWTILFFPWCKLLAVTQTLHHICCSFLEMVSFLCGQSNIYII